MNKMLVTLAEVLAAVALQSALLENQAAACGGTFCDSGPLSMAVDQTGENILFVMDGSSVEANIQISYKGDAARFAWVLPVPTIPTLSVGSAPLFAQLLAATAPTYGYSQSLDCPPPAGCTAVGCSVGCSAGCTSSCGGPTVVLQEAVGAFDVTVLSGGTAQEVSDWLSTNGYAATPTTPDALAPYVAKSYVFVAVKLTGQTGVDSIHPLVVKYPGTMPCIPLILTREAALDNMGVRAFFLGNDRVFPENYADVVLNPLRIDWLGLGDNYDAVVTRAVDEAPDHHGFVTEYAGRSGIVRESGVYEPFWDASVFQTIAPEDVPTAVRAQGLGGCSGGFCRWEHPLILPLLHQYLPPQGGLSDVAWYSNLPQHAQDIDLTAWSNAGFTADFDARIVQPGKTADAELHTYPYLTRMFTTISPSEMTEDPTFNARPDLSDQLVSNVHLATLRTLCDGQQIMELPDGLDVWIPTSGTWPPFSSDLPYALSIDTVPASGPTVPIRYNGAAINSALESWNNANGALDPGATDVTGNQLAGGGCGCRLSGDDDAWYGLALAAGFIAIGLRRRRAG